MPSQHNTQKFNWYVVILNSDMPANGAHYRVAYYRRNIEAVRNDRKRWTGRKTPFLVRNWTITEVEDITIYSPASGNNNGYKGKIYLMESKNEE